MKFQVIIEQESQDCDGPMHYTPREAVMSLEELKAEAGEMALEYMSVTKEFLESGSVILLASSPTDEGFRRKSLSFYELEEA